MSGTRNKSKKLWQTENEIEDLWDEEEHQSLAKVAENTHNSECHASEIAESITDKNRCRKPRKQALE